MGLIQSVYNNVIFYLYSATNQSMKDRRKRMVHLDTAQLNLIQEVIMH